MKRTGKIVITLVAVLLLVLTAACAPAPGVTPPEEVAPPEEITPPEVIPPEEVTPPPTLEPAPTVERGIIEIRVTDPGVVGVLSAWVTAENIMIHPAGADDDGWITIISSPPIFDLVYLANSENASILGEADILAGNFTGIRMDVTSVSGNTTDNVSYTAEVPSGKLRIVRPFKVGPGLKTVLTLDFDLSKSLIMTGRVIAGKPVALFKPVVKLLIEHEKGGPPADRGEPEGKGKPKEGGPPEGKGKP